MRTSPWLVAAAAGWLQLSACAAPTPVKVPRAGQPARHRPAVDRGPDRSAGPRARAAHAPPSSGDTGEDRREQQRREGLVDVSWTHEQLVERYGHARALAVQQGSCSYYSDALAGRPTASGAPYVPAEFTAAHLSLPFGSVLRVTRRDGGQSVYVRVTDRGPYGSRGRVLDLSRAAAQRLGMLRAGVVPIKIEVLEYGRQKSRRRR